MIALRYVSFSINQCEQYHGQGARVVRGPRELGMRSLAARTTVLHCKSMLCPQRSKLERLEAQLQQLERKTHHWGFNAWHAWIASLKIGGAELHASMKDLHQRFNQLPPSEKLRLLFAL